MLQKDLESMRSRFAIATLAVADIVGYWRQLGAHVLALVEGSLPSGRCPLLACFHAGADMFNLLYSHLTVVICQISY